MRPRFLVGAALLLLSGTAGAQNTEGSRAENTLASLKVFSTKLARGERTEKSDELLRLTVDEVHGFVARVHTVLMRKA